MANATGKDLTTEQVKNYLNSAPDCLTVPILDLGKLLQAECSDRGKQLDAKATSLMGYGGVLVTLMVSSFLAKIPEQRPVLDSAVWVLIFGSLLAEMLGICASLSVVWLADYEWFSDRDWFAASPSTADQMFRTHVLAMHRYKGQHETVNARKAWRLKVAYGAAVAGVALLLLAGMVGVATASASSPR